MTSVELASYLAPLCARLDALASRLVEYRSRYDAARDSRAVFTHAYATITNLISKNLGCYEFRDPECVVVLAEKFAGHYFDALDRRDRGEALSPAWVNVFDVICDQRTSVLEDLVFAMTAHIVHDLPLALLDAHQSTDDGSSRIYDFHRMNDLLGRNVEAITSAVSKRYEPFIAWLDHLGGDFDLILTDYGFRVGRGVAWYNASRIVDPLSEEHARKSIVKSTIVFVENVRRPKFWPLRLLFRIGRWLSSFFRRWPGTSHAVR